MTLVQPAANTTHRNDNIQVELDIDSVRESTWETISFFHGVTKTKSQEVALSAPSYEATMELRVPIRPAVTLSLRIAWYGDCDLNPNTPTTYCYEIQQAGQKIHNDVKYRRVVFHNVDGPSTAATTVTKGHLARLIDDDRDLWNTTNKNVDWVYGRCSGNSINQFSNPEFEDNWEGNSTSLFSQFSIDWIQMGGQIHDCSDFTATADTDNFDLWEYRCRSTFRNHANSVDPTHQYLHVYAISGMGGVNAGYCGFVKGDSDIAYMDADQMVAANTDLAARCLAHEIGHTLGLGHCATGGVCILSDCTNPNTDSRNVMCGDGPIGTTWKTAQCNTVYASTSYPDFN